MRYNSIIYNDTANAPGICVSVYLQGCERACRGCFNPETWDFNGGKEFTPEVLSDIKRALVANGVKRSLCILGGEPLCPDNVFLTNLICKTIREFDPSIKIYIWTGYTIEELLLNKSNPRLTEILSGKVADVLIDGPFKEELKDLTLPMRGSSNQRIINLPFDFS